MESKACENGKAQCWDIGKAQDWKSSEVKSNKIQGLENGKAHNGRVVRFPVGKEKLDPFYLKVKKQGDLKVKILTGSDPGENHK